ncbi:hypothetical protein V1227_20880 [Lentzea sp. DG1S-22]|uniref:hypothetical protein n=1 Tax=Lentzea sp. DG1S-22 TaxID=3108822 RepID=UPI002E77E804|nr:hypothetical protein [Lentzea sp. DG1S-22]WVH77575.1 hypothetical protein V1227_20880 [Lentzea sp. DG1S-22]
MAARGETQANVEVSTLVVPAWMLRWRAPELALVLGERAVALASTRRDEADRLRAEALVVFAGNRVGRGVRFADRALDALKAAEAAGEHETGWLLRVELAACARSVGAPLTGFAAVMPVLEAPDVPAELRASALVQASECLVTVGRGDEPARALAEADQLYVADTTLDEDTRLLLRGLIRAVQAAQHRRWGDIAAAIGAAREGLDLLSRFSDPAADSGQGVGHLTLELVLALMDANRLHDASEAGDPLLHLPVRAPSASTTGWLRLALATRVHLPAGRVALARQMLREAAVSAERHQLDTLLAESLLALAHVNEVSGDLADALTNLRSAHAAERRRARAVYAVRARLAAEFSGVHRQPADLHQQLAGLLRPVEGAQVATDGVLPAALKQQLRQWRPVQVRKGDGLKVKRARRAAEDMTVEGLSAARQHAADRWRMVQPFGEPDDKTPEPVEPPPASLPSSPSPTPASPSSSERTVPASGLIASAGAMVSGRRRAARVAAGEIDDRPTTIAEIPVATDPPPAAPPASEPPAPEQPAPQPPAPQVQLTVEQQRKRKVEQQLMELQREARRQIEEERQARAEQRAQAEREARAAEEAARQEAERQEAARLEAARKEAAEQEAARREAARQEAARQEAARLEAARQEAARLEAERQEAARQEAARLEAARQEAARLEAERQEAARLEAARLEAARQEAARLEAARQEAARQEEARREAARLEAVRRDVARQEAAHQEVARRAGEREAAARAEAPARDEAAQPQQESVLDMLKAQGLRAGGRRRAREAEPESRPESRAGIPSWRVEPPTSLRRDEPSAESPSQDRSAIPGSSDHHARPGLSAAFSRAPAAPDFGPHLDEPAFPPHTPADGFPAVPDPDERRLPDLDFSLLDLNAPKPKPKPEPEASLPAAPEHPDQQPEPDPAPLPPTPDPVPAVPEPEEVPPSPQPDLMTSTFLSSADVEDDSGDVPTVPVRRPDQPQPASGTQTGFGDRAGFGTQPSFGTQTFGTQSSFGTQSAFATPSSFNARPDFDPQPDEGPATGSGPATADEPESAVEYDFFATEPGSPAGPDAGHGTGADAPPAEAGDRTGRPSSRRRPSEMSLADLLAEALVAYETGRRSDEEQFEASDLSPAGWSAAEPPAEQPSGEASGVEQKPAAEAEPVTGFGVQQDAAVQTLPGSAALGQEKPFGSEVAPSSDSYFQPGRYSRSQEAGTSPNPEAPSSDGASGADLAFGRRRRPVPETPVPDAFPSSPSFGTQPVADTGTSPGSATPVTPSFGSPQAFGSAQPVGSAPEAEQEKTGPIVPVGVAPDNETTGPIRRFGAEGPGWTLPGA